MQPRVPEGQLEEARALTKPFLTIPWVHGEMGHAREWEDDRITTDHTIIEEGRNHVVKND